MGMAKKNRNTNKGREKMSEGFTIYPVRCIKCKETKHMAIPIDKWICPTCMNKHKKEHAQETSFDKGEQP